MFSDLPANKILMNHREVEEQEEKLKTEEMQKIEEKASKFSSGIYIVSMHWGYLITTIIGWYGKWYKTSMFIFAL